MKRIIKHLPKIVSILLVGLLIGIGTAIASPKLSIKSNSGYLSVDLQYGLTARAAISVTSLGTGSDKGSSSTIVVYVSDIEEGDYLFCVASVDYALHGFYYFYDGYNCEATDVLDVSADNSGNVRVGIFGMQVENASSSGAFVRFNGSSADAKAVAFYQVSGLADSPLDQTNSNTGTDAPYNTGSSGILSQDDELCIAVIGIEEETDNLGSWTTGTGYVSGNEQSDGTTGQGGASNISVASASLVVSDGTSQAYEGNMDAGRPDWAACIATYKMASGGCSEDISNTGGNWALGVVNENSTYWANGSEPSFPLTDGDAKWTVTNNSGGSIDINIKGTDFTGGVGWTLASSQGTNQVVLVAYKEGDGSGDGITLTTSNQLFINSLADSADIDWEMKLLTATSHTDGVAKSSTVTITAVCE